LPEFVKDECDAFLECGILAHGFLRLRCAACTHEKLVAFSCKRRGFCPSCGARRMAETAAHLVDYVIPRVPVRQWVLSFPIPLAHPVGRPSAAALGGAANRSSGHRDISDQASRTETVRSPHRRGHPHSALGLDGQSEHSPALPGTGWVYQRTEHGPVFQEARAQQRAARGLTRQDHRASDAAADSSRRPR
jgi:Transposase zinc-binding domain